MSNITINKDRMKELAETGFDLTNVRPMMAGSEPPSSGWWLQDLSVCSVFLARAKPSAQQMKASIELTEYGIFNKTEKCTLLLVRQPDGTIPIWVDTKGFSNQVEYFETLRTNDPQIEAMRMQAFPIKEEENELSDIRSVQSDGLPDDAGHQV